MLIQPRPFLRYTLILSGLLLASCQKGTQSGPTQTIAKAAGTEITVHELRHGLGGMRSTQEQEKRALEALVDQTILAKKAVEEGLEKEPSVALTLAATRRAVLAQAYSDKVVGKGAVPTEVEIKSYYEKSPHLFGLRRVYAFRSIGIPVSVASLEQIQAVLSKSKSLDAFRDAMGPAVKTLPVRQRVSPAEELPVEISEAFLKIKKGGLGLVGLKDQSQVLQVVDIQEAPVSLEVAKPTIQRLMMEQAKRERLEQLVLSSRKEAGIEYFGDFAVKPEVAKAAGQSQNTEARTGPSAATATVTAPSLQKNTDAARTGNTGANQTEQEAKRAPSSLDRGVAAMR
jgi:EpsD family peptidyl-prolyl cis-trans isomerase